MGFRISCWFSGSFFEVLSFEFYTERCFKKENFSCLWDTDRICRPVKVAAGQADGITPRTIEVLQVRYNSKITSKDIFTRCSFFWLLHLHYPLPRSVNRAKAYEYQSYGLAERLLREGTQLHMAVRLSHSPLRLSLIHTRRSTTPPHPGVSNEQAAHQT